MNYIQLDANLPTLSRWIKLNQKYSGESTLRMLEYEMLETLEMAGSVLDVGGGDNSYYRNQLPENISYKSINIDPKMKPTYLLSPGDQFPIEDNSFDALISLNTLEHVYDNKAMLKEMFRVLRPGGVMYVCVPWMFRIHGHPDDFNRVTPSWWQTTLQQIGFSACELTPLVWGRYSTAASLIGYKLMPKLIGTHLDHFKDIILAIFMPKNSQGKYSGPRAQRIYDRAPGHFLKVTK